MAPDVYAAPKPAGAPATTWHAAGLVALLTMPLWLAAVAL